MTDEELKKLVAANALAIADLRISSRKTTEKIDKIVQVQEEATREKQQFLFKKSHNT